MSTIADRDEILKYLHGYLRVADFRDYGPQGVQVEGRAEVRKIVTAVSAGVELFEKAAAAGADLILVHHGIFWDNESRVVRGGLKRRLELLLQSGMTLAAYHLCLDAHPEVGNNALAARELGLTDLEPWGESGGKLIGYRGAWQPGKSPAEAVAALEELYGGETLSFLHGPEVVRKVGIISGGAQGRIGAAIEDGLDLFVTGEAAEFSMNTARDGGIHFVAAGHYRTERLGIRALGEHVAARFGVGHEFVEVPNPV